MDLTRCSHMRAPSCGDDEREQERGGDDHSSTTQTNYSTKSLSKKEQPIEGRTVTEARCRCNLATYGKFVQLFVVTFINPLKILQGIKTKNPPHP